MGDDDLRQQALDEELIPLSVAATVAYFHLTDAITQTGQADILLRAVGVTALAISQVATIHLRVAGEPARALSAAELERLLVRPILEDALRPDLDRFLIRRGALRRALAIMPGRLELLQAQEGTRFHDAGESAPRPEATSSNRPRP